MQWIEGISNIIQEVKIPENLIIGNINFIVEKGLEYSINNQEGNLQESNYLKRTQEYTLYYEGVKIPISIQLYSNVNHHYRIFAYTKNDKMLTSLNLTTNLHDDLIRLEIPIKISTQKENGQVITKEKRLLYRNQLVKKLIDEDFIVDKNTVLLGNYSIKENNFIDILPEEFIIKFLKLAILKGYYSQNTHYQSLKFYD